MLRIQSTLPDETEQILRRILGCAVAVHRELGPGFLERIYQDALCLEMDSQRMRFEREKVVPVRYKGHTITSQRVDLMVEDRVIVEVKCVDRFDRIHEAQVLSYLRATGLRVGILMNFKTPVLAQGLRRIVL